MNSFTIKDLENLSGIKAHTIRIWEQRYSFIKPQRTDTNIRYYTGEELKTILNISLLNKYGFKISHIDKMTNEEIKERLLQLNDSEAQVERIVNELIQEMIDLNFIQFEQIIDFHIQKRGIEKTIIQLIFPFLEKVGILWVTNHINPVQEHVVTNIIRQKLIFGIEKIRPIIKSSKTVVIFLPEGEHHELGILFMYFLLKSRGVRVIYLGANVPIKDIQYVNDLKNPDFIYTHLTSVAGNFNFERFLQQVSLRAGNTPVIISGKITKNYKKEVPENVKFMHSIEAVTEYII